MNVQFVQTYKNTTWNKQVSNAQNLGQLNPKDTKAVALGPRTLKLQIPKRTKKPQIQFKQTHIHPTRPNCTEKK